MQIYKIEKQKKEIIVQIPLTSSKEKTRIKKRNGISDFGISVATRQEVFKTNFYVEWQIGYDVKVNDEKASRTTLQNETFIGANGNEKYLYELSEYIKYFYDWKIIDKTELLSIKKYLVSTPKITTLDYHEDLSIKKSYPIEKEINNINFLYMRVEYPMLVYSFKEYTIIAEIQTKERQNAVGLQPMLYFCFPITELNNSENLLNRTAERNEKAYFTIDASKKQILLDMLKIFGTLTSNHKQDVISIINIITKEV